MISKQIKNILLAFNAVFNRLKFVAADYPCKISPLATFKGFKNKIKIGSNTLVMSNAYFHCDKNSSITIGKNCEIHHYARIMTYGGDIKIGDNCSVNPYSILYGHGGLHIGSGVRIAAHVVVIPANHAVARLDIPIMEQGIENLPTRIDDNVWIGSGAKILGGVIIHSGAVVGANAVVTRNVPENAIVAGVPAKVIRFRDGGQEPKK